MKSPSQPLYPKLSSIYNKLTQLAIAIVLIVVLLNLWVASNGRSEKTIHDHFYATVEQHLEQSISVVQSLQLIDNKSELKEYVEGIAKADWIYDVRLYDETGKIIAASSNSVSIKDVYGITLNKSNKSDAYIPFIQEIRGNELNGYMRITVKKGYFTDELFNTNYDNHAMVRLMMLIAVCIGFLLTRGLNRFSRQGFRPHLEK